MLKYPMDYDISNPKPMFAHIVAMDKNGCIGKDGKLAWKIKDELAYYRDTTTKLWIERQKLNPIIVGRKTYDSLPAKAKEHRFFYVISKQNLENTNNTVYCKTIEQAKQLAIERMLSYDIPPCLYPVYPIFIIGGQSIYKQTIDDVNAIYTSIVTNTWVDDGDAFYPLKFPYDNCTNFHLIENKNFAVFVSYK